MNKLEAKVVADSWSPFTKWADKNGWIKKYWVKKENMYTYAKMINLAF